MTPQSDWQSLPFPEAIEYFKQKLPLPSTQWEQFSGEAQDWAFTIAGITSADLLNDVYQMIRKAIENGDSFGDFKKNFTAAVDKAGWTGATPWRTELIFNQNIRNAYQSGRYKQQFDPQMLKRRPYLQYVHGDSRQPRPAHLALDGKIYPAGHDFWKTAYPCNGFGCRCKALSMSKRDIEREGLTVEEPPSQTLLVRDRMTGKTTRVPALDVGGKLTPIAEPGFTTPPGASQKSDAEGGSLRDHRSLYLRERLDKLPPSLRKLVEEQLNIG